MKPILLIPGVCGSRLEARHTESGKYIEDAWVSNRITKPSHIGEAIMKYLWGDYDPVSDLMVSFNPQIDIRACKGLSGCDVMMDSKLLHNPSFNRRNFALYFHIMIKNLESIGYQRNKDLFAYTFDWRQPLYHESILGPLNLLMQNIHKMAQQKITVVAHSMGGLLIMQYMERFSEWGDHIDRLICLGTPFDGASGYTILSATHGYNMRKPIRQSVFRGFESKCPAVLCLHPQPFNNLPIDSKVFFKLSIDSNESSKILSETELQMDDGEIYCQGSAGKNEGLDWEDVELIPEVYGEEEPDSCFLILQKLKRNPQLLQYDMEYWIQRLRRGCKEGSVKFNVPMRDLHQSKKNTQEHASRNRADKILGKNFKYGIASVEDIQSSNFEWQCYGFACETCHHNLKQTRVRPEVCRRSKIDFKQIVRYSEHPNVLEEAVMYELFLESEAVLELPPLLRKDNRFYKTSTKSLEDDTYPSSSSDSDICIENVEICEMAPGPIPWKLHLAEHCIYDLFDQICPTGTMDRAIFGFDTSMLETYEEHAIPPSKIKYQKDFKFMSIVGSELPTPLHVYFEKPVKAAYELAYQQPECCCASGDSTVLLASALSDPIPDEYVYDKVVIPGLQHLHMLFDETVFFLLKSFLKE